MFRDTYKVLKISFTRERMKKTSTQGHVGVGLGDERGGRDAARQE